MSSVSGLQQSKCPTSGTMPTETPALSCSGDVDTVFFGEGADSVKCVKCVRQSECPTFGAMSSEAPALSCRGDADTVLFWGDPDCVTPNLNSLSARHLASC